MKTIIEKQILEWKEELKAHKERLAQAEQVVEQENKFISMIEGGIQAQEILLKKIESSDQPAYIEGQEPIQESKSTRSKGQPA
jgi:sugar-specific transcriptional regulator TrmB|tara:strand:+ start:337 stop:585 length:249 start_codon:yes stop_codon:yes gene_type:complete